ncbi:MAG: hypothetical protein HQL26_03260 [Candidatus Omnitrophica bacterium]|nr:hypothetical protein [Candidatus Omnitrophota bacterium]
MIVGIIGKLICAKEQSLTLNVHGLYYEVMVPAPLLQRLDQIMDADGNISLVTYHYHQISPSSGTPVLIGFANDVERDFFMRFITVSGIGPRAAVKALDRPMSEIAQAISAGDVKFLTSLPGIGTQRAKEIVAKLQTKMAKFALIQDQVTAPSINSITASWQEEALEVLLQLQYKRPEAMDMIEKALKRVAGIKSTEELLNEIYKQRVSK